MGLNEKRIVEILLPQRNRLLYLPNAGSCNAIKVRTLILTVIPRYGIQVCEGRLKRLKNRSYRSVLQPLCECWNSGRRHYGGMAALVREGKVRHHGLSNEVDMQGSRYSEGAMKLVDNWEVAVPECFACIGATGWSLPEKTVICRWRAMVVLHGFEDAKGEKMDKRPFFCAFPV